MPAAELNDILATIAQSRATGFRREILRGERDIVVIDAKTDRQTGYTSWAMKRLPGKVIPVAHRREILQAALVLAALLSVTGTLPPASFCKGYSPDQKRSRRLSKPISATVCQSATTSSARSAIRLTVWPRPGRNWRPTCGARTVCAPSAVGWRGLRTKYAIR